MKLYEKNWWKKTFQKKTKEKKTDVLKDIEAITEFMKESHSEMLDSLQKLEELEKERTVTKSNILKINLQTQGKLLDHLLEEYNYLENDTVINGLRLKIIAKEFLKHVDNEGLHNIIKEKKKNHFWKF